jgi:hypothetical protein
MLDPTFTCCIGPSDEDKYRRIYERKSHMNLQNRGLKRTCRALALAAGLVILPLVLLAATGSDVTGNWQGALDAGAQGKLRLIVHISQAKDGSLSGTVDSPDQGALGIPITKITYEGLKLHFECASIPGNAHYDGTVSKDKSQITGDWSQSGGTLPLNLTKAK